MKRIVGQAPRLDQHALLGKDAPAHEVYAPGCVPAGVAPPLREGEVVAGDPSPPGQAGARVPAYTAVATPTRLVMGLEQKLCPNFMKYKS